MTGGSRAAVLALLLTALGCGADGERGPAPAPPERRGAALPAWTDELIAVRDRALGEESAAASLTVATAVGISARSPGALPAALAEAAQLCHVVPFVGSIDGSAERRGNVYDDRRRTAFVDVRAVAAIDATGHPSRAGALRFALALVLADGARAACGERWSEAVRCASAGALMRTFLAAPGDAEPADADAFAAWLELLEEELGPPDERAVSPVDGAGPRAHLPRPEHHAPFARGYREPDLGFTGAYGRRR
ncbi:MAG: hypothetical protein AAFP86_00755 [Planctomycetota bacterium]